MTDPDYTPSTKQSNLLYAAILSGENERLTAALQGKPDLDADSARALILCAEQNNYRMAKRLYFAGADMTYALVCMESTVKKSAREQDTIVLSRLKNFYEGIIKDALPAEQLKLTRELIENQKRIESKIDDFRAALDALAGPQTIDKPELKKSGAASFPPKGQKP